MTGYSVVQSCVVTIASGTTGTATFPHNMSSGTKLLAWAVWAGSGSTTGAVSSITDAHANSFTQQESFTEGGTGGTAFYLYTLDTPAADVGAAAAITITGNSTGGAAMLVQEVAGLVPGSAAATILDGTPGSTGAHQVASGSLTPATPTYSSTTTSEYLAYMYADNGDNGNSITATPSGYTMDSSSTSGSVDANVQVGYKPSTGGTETGSYTLTSPAGNYNYGLILVAFKIAPPKFPGGRTTGRAPARRGGRAAASRGAPVTAPVVALAPFKLPGQARGRGRGPRGRAAASAGAPVFTPPPQTAPFKLPGQARGRGQRPRGRAAGSAGAPVFVPGPPQPPNVQGGNSGGTIRDSRPRLGWGAITAIPERGATLERPVGRGYAGPHPERADDLTHDWDEAPPAELAEPGPSVGQVAADEAARAGRALLGLGRILAPEPYVQRPKTRRCRAERRVGGRLLRCGRGEHTEGMHAAEGLYWKLGRKVLWQSWLPSSPRRPGQR